MQKETKGKKVVANTNMQKKYTYFLTEPSGKNFDKDFRPDLTPKEMLALGVFGGNYFGEIPKEFPKSWFVGAKLLSKNKMKMESDGEFPKDSKINFFKVSASQPLSVWKEKGWIHKDDPHGWFEWYCRYFMGRRIPEEDARQIKRWNMMRRHVAQIKNKCRVGDFACNSRQRQALLHWGYDSRRM